MDDIIVSSAGSSPKINYTLLDGEREGLTCRQWCKATASIIVIVALLTVLTPLYIVIRGYYGRADSTSAGDIPELWIERAIYYSNSVDDQTGLVRNLSSAYKLVCYYTFPSLHSVDVLHLSDIDPQLCTHINVGFATVVNNSIFVNDNQSQMIRDAVSLKRQNPNLKVLLSVGGSGGAGGFPDMVLNHTTRKFFIKSIDNYVRAYGIDGIDLDWEFPNKEPSRDSRQKIHFTQLLYEIRKEIRRQRRYTFLLTVAVAAPRFIIDLAYDVAYVNSYVDFINVMTYDYHFYTSFTPFTGINSPLYADVNQTGYLSTLNINYTIHYWMEKGMDAEKIIVGLPTYAHCFGLINENNNGIMAPARGYGSLDGSGFVNRAGVCAFLAKDGVKLEFDYSARSPYASREYDWVSYDDETSLTFKTEYVKYNKLGGAMILSLNADDHRARCSKGSVKFPLTRRVKEVLNEV